MTTYTLKSRPIPLDDSWDVVVFGGGPSGCTAAAAAARDGARTLLVEATGMLGGMGTAGLVPAWCPFSDGKQVIHRGLAWEVFDRSRNTIPHVRKEQPVDWVPINPEALKRIYDDLVTGAGARVLFHSMVIDAEVEDGEIRCAVVANKAGLTAYRAKVFVDCTGDGDLAVMAGAAFEKGDADGSLQPATHCFVITNVDTYCYWTGATFHQYDPNSPIHEMVASDKYPLIVDKHTCNSQIGPEAMGFNTGHVYGVDNTDPWSVSDALIHGRKMAAQYRDGLAALSPAFANSYLAATGALLGVRETRRILGDYVLTFEDYQARRSFSDEIGRNSYYIDVHQTEAEARALAGKSLDDVKKAFDAETYHYQPGESHGIPYRCLTPRGLRNVLMAGRCISSDRPVNGSVRVMPVCLVTGEAAGVAAAQAAAHQGDVHAVDTDALRARLRGCGAYLPEKERIQAG